MSVVNEIRNFQPNNQDKCELVLINPCFNNRFFSVRRTLNLFPFRRFISNLNLSKKKKTDLYSLKSFTTNDYGEMAKQPINPLMGLENEFMKSLNSNLDEQSENDGTSLKFDSFY